MFFGQDYFRASVHPLVAGSFVLSIFLGYELGIYLLGAGDGLAWRTGLDAGLRLIIRQRLSPKLEWMPAGTLGLALLVYCGMHWRDRPAEFLGTWAGMIVESILLALPLLWLAHWCGSLEFSDSVRGQIGFGSHGASIVASLGAGVYEEVVFRGLLLWSLLVGGRCLGLRGWVKFLWAGGASAVLFACAHHVPPFQEPYQKTVFLFRVFAGLYFAILFWFRGLGIAAGVHACYDILASFQ
ncbi:MAG: CPBP family intramembrane glutamic endopeptidase [Gemmatales bacterium]|nr:CPBP family intramembrane metalloprotease [Gemmatales bacterium]MDW7995686.1 CPBP family intramembrane glutamic endopeptidase [Gemmatales bacterium]